MNIFKSEWERDRALKETLIAIRNAHRVIKDRQRCRLSIQAPLTALITSETKLKELRNKTPFSKSN